MGRLKKCLICGEYIGTDEVAVPYKNRYAHEKCFNIAIKTLQKDKQEKIQNKEKQKKRTSKPRAELKESVSEEEYKEKKQYYSYLHDLLNDDLSAKIYAVSEDYIKRYGFTWDSMYQTLVYLHEIMEKELTGDIIGIIPYYHDEAKKYNESIQLIQKTVEDVDVSQMYKQKTIIFRPNRQKKKKPLDIETIGGKE